MDIPNEIYAQIFGYLNPRDIRQCLLVCIDWNHLLTSSRKYKELTILKDNIVAFKARLDKDKQYKNWIWVQELRIIRPMIPPSHLVHYDGARRKNYDDELLPTLTKKQFLKLVSSLPNLQRLEISSEECKMLYLNWLLEVNTNENLTRLEEIYDSDYYCVDKEYESCALRSNGLRKINYLGGYCDFYNDLYFKFHKSLTSLSIYYGPSSSINHKYGGLLKYLSHFKKLAHLSYVGEESITLYQLQAACPHLITLQFELIRTFPMYEIGDNGFRYHNLKELKLSVPYITANFTDVIAEQLPASVQELFINMYDIDIYNWVKKVVGLERVLKLVKRMSKINRVELDYLGDTKYKDEIFMATFFRILNTLKNDRKINCTGYFKESETVHHHIRVTETCLDFMYELKCQEFAKEANATVFNLASSSESSLIGGPEIMNKVEFCVSSINEAPEHYYKLLSYFLNNCPNLQHLKFYGDFISLELCPTVAVFCGKKFEFSNPPRKNLEVVKLKNLIPSRDFLHLLRSHLPNVNYMIFKCSSKTVKLYKSKPLKDIVVDLRNFGNLEMICFDVRFLLWNFMSMCFIVFEYLDGEVQYYECTTYPMKLVPIPFNYRKSHDTYTVTFKCEKVRRFVLHDGCNDADRVEGRDDFVEINYGGRPKNPLNELQYRPARHNLRYSLYYSPFI